MKRERRGKKITPLLWAILMLFSIMVYMEVPVSAATIGSTTVTTKIQEVGRYSIKINWEHSPLASGYIIYRKVENYSYKPIKTVDNNVTTYLDQGLTPATSYRYAVRAYRKEGNQTVQSRIHETAIVTRPDITTVRAKVNSDTQATVSWRKVERADGYRIYRRASMQNWQLVSDVLGNSTSYVDNKLSPNTKYVYTVRAYKSCGNAKYLAAYIINNKIIQSNVVTTPAGSSKFNSSQKEVMKKILYAVETGGNVYGKQDYSDFTQAYKNSNIEHAITIGAGQWYGVEAQRLLKRIQYASPATWKKYDPQNLVWNDLKYENWSYYNISKKTEKAKIIINLISSPAGIHCQDQLMYLQIEEMEAEIRKLGITEPKSVGMFINIRHQGGYSAVTRVLNKTRRPVTLDNIYKALQTDMGNQVGAYRTRQKMVYESLNKYMK